MRNNEVKNWSLTNCKRKKRVTHLLTFCSEVLLHKLSFLDDTNQWTKNQEGIGSDSEHHRIFSAGSPLWHMGLRHPKVFSNIRLIEPSKKSSSAWAMRTDGWIGVLNLKLWGSSRNLEGLTIFQSIILDVASYSTRQLVEKLSTARDRGSSISSLQFMDVKAMKKTIIYILRRHDHMINTSAY
ncbi:hypothetical protein SDJN03_10294, partial [Cucurbita argyrosperma subsp. sororia]